MQNSGKRGRLYGTRKSILVIAVILVMTALCGCDLFGSVNLTPEESGLIAEYAAGLLRKYDINGKLKEVTDIPEEIATESQEPVQEEPVADEMATEEVLPDETEMPVEDLSSDTGDVEPDFFDITQGIDADDVSDDSPEAQEQITANASIAEIIGVDDFDISYQGYDILDKYPENSDNSWLISMAAKEGKKLCVLKFAITNLSSADAVCDILNSGKSYRLIVNDEKKINESVTVLMDSFSQFAENLAPGETRDAVLIFEPDSGLADSIGSLKLIIKDSETSDTLELQ